MANFANYAAMKVQVSAEQIVSMVKVSAFQHLMNEVHNTETAQDIMSRIKMADLIDGGVCDIRINDKYYTLSVWNLVNPRLGGII